MSSASVPCLYGPGVSTPKKPSPLRADITENLGVLDLGDGEKTPTQANFPRIVDDSDDKAPNTPTSMRPVKGRGGIVVGGHIRKSASTMNLRARVEDDVFGPTINTTDSDSPALINVSANHPAKQAIDAINRITVAQYKARGYGGYTPREDRGLIPNVNNAQGLFHPDANVFVANLSNQLSEDQLELSCHSVFDVFGPNYIKVKFDKNDHPFALVQFETVEAAQEAIIRARGTILEGRQIRIEQSRVERAVIIFRTDGNLMTENEAREMLSPFGELDFTCPTSVLRGRAGNLPDGIYARFAFYLDCRDALKGFFETPCHYRIQLATGFEPVLRRLPNSSALSKNLTPPRSITDCKSVFVGNLPEGTTKDELAELFRRFGPVVDTNVVNKTYVGNSQNVFGFVEFATSSQANAAASIEQYLGDKKLRIEPKEYSARRMSRMNAMPVASPIRTPRRISPAASAALAMRLASNEVENHFVQGPPPPSFNSPSPAYSYALAEWQTPTHYIPAHLFSPSPPNPYYDPYYYEGN